MNDFDLCIKKKEHKLYGAFGPKEHLGPMKKATKITFDWINFLLQICSCFAWLMTIHSWWRDRYMIQTLQPMTYNSNFVSFGKAPFHDAHSVWLTKLKLKPIFRCASISCTDDRHRLTDSLIETGDWQICMFDSSRTNPLVFYRVGIFVWSVWSFCVICNILKLSAFCIASLGRIFSLVNFSCAWIYPFPALEVFNMSIKIRTFWKYRLEFLKMYILLTNFSENIDIAKKVFRKYWYRC